jgi:hypothetical protein
MNFGIFISTNRKILQDLILFFHNFLLFEKKNSENFNISENDIINVKAAKVVSSRVILN